MRVLQINAVYKIGSTGRMTMELHEYMEKMGIDSYVACAIGCSKNSKKEYLIGNRFDMLLHSTLSRLTGLQSYFSAIPTLRLLSLIKKLQPDIVHLGNLHSNYVNIGMLCKFLAKSKIAVAITLHDCWFFTGKCSHYTIDNCYRWQKKCGSCPRLNKDIPSWFFDFTEKMLIDKQHYFSRIERFGVIGVSDWITSEAKKSILKNANYIERIYNWIDLEVFSENQSLAADFRSNLGLINKKVLLGVASLWNNSKGLNHFIELSDLLKDDEVIVLIGNIEQKLTLPNNIINIGCTQSVDELVGYYSMADVFLQLSPEESFGKVVAEALACGTPVIAVNSTANTELILNGVGMLCDLGDVQSLRNSLDSIYSLLSNTYSKKCRNFSEENFSLQNQLSKYISFYKKLLE